MLTRIALTDLTKYHIFHYYPVRLIGDDCVEFVKDGKLESVTGYAVVGEFYSESGPLDEDWIADFSVLTEAAGYCLMLNAALKGEQVLFDPPKPKEE